MELSPADKEKEALIRAACEHGDVASLIDLATSSSGLLSDSLRRTACKLPTAHPSFSYTTTDRLRASLVRMFGRRLEQRAGKGAP